MAQHVQFTARTFSFDLTALCFRVRAKKCLDFSVTLFLMHLFVSVWHGGFPRRIEWWIVHIAATITMIVLGEYLCIRRELDEIPLLNL
jgi:protein SYS1